MAHETEIHEDIVNTIESLAEKLDDFRVILTGIINFEAGIVKEEGIKVAKEMIKGDWIKAGATVIDVGINRIEKPDAVAS